MVVVKVGFDYIPYLRPPPFSIVHEDYSLFSQRIRLCYLFKDDDLQIFPWHIPKPSWHPEKEFEPLKYSFISF